MRIKKICFQNKSYSKKYELYSYEYTGQIRGKKFHVKIFEKSPSKHKTMLYI